MRILIVGLPKSGTTILTYRIAEAIDGVHIDFEPQAGPDDANLEAGVRNVVTKKLVGSQTEDLSEFSFYDRKIWISRDPRDFLISQSLYRWHREGQPDQADQEWFDRILQRLQAKESDPASVPFQDLEPADYFESLDAVAELHNREVDESWFVYRYEDMVDGDYQGLNQYLGFDVVAGAEVAVGLERVVRRKGYGDWRDWFTPADVEHYSSGGLRRYMTTFGYSLNDWDLNDPQHIDPAHCSEYAAALFYDHRPSAPDSAENADVLANGDDPANVAIAAGARVPNKRAATASDAAVPGVGGWRAQLSKLVRSEGRGLWRFVRSGP